MKYSKLLPGLLAAAVSSTSFAAGLAFEGFDNIANLPAKGWAQKNNSTAGGLQLTWFQGNTAVFPAADGPTNSYIAANFNAAPTSGGSISQWLFTPVLDLTARSTVNFLFQLAGDGFLDRIEVRLSTNGNSTNVGSTPTSVGDFSTLLGSYESDTNSGWLPFSFSAGLPSDASGRLAFRYVVSDVTVNGNYIGIDSVSVVPEPMTLALVALALGGMALKRRRA